MPNPPTPEEIKALRAARGWTQRDLAAHLIGSADQMHLLMDWHNALMRVRNWEQGTDAPDRHNTDRLSRLMDTESQS